SLTHPLTAFIFTLSLHDALPIWTSRLSSRVSPSPCFGILSNTSVAPHAPRAIQPAVPASAKNPGRHCAAAGHFFFDGRRRGRPRSEEHTSELQSLTNLVCRLLLD